MVRIRRAIAAASSEGVGEVVKVAASKERSVDKEKDTLRDEAVELEVSVVVCLCCLNTYNMSKECAVI